ncbi:DnaJ C-terminal domain-containing protein [Thauera sp.]|uniref:DnaJ C-terminal domain-containing protein n=1 Tax=Thauera sp. TaxID=1905334 RepID=UPI002C0C9AE2|nr:DnaJ C-terminal domain-containing protein [Thauera sp.]HRP23263.1 DnaJ C-terminal domain-containing protein [Thauera sp.]
MHDAHQLLGLQPGATRPQIKRAFRHLAMRWHPDRNADPHAVEHFKALRQAHDALLAALLDGESGIEPARPDAAEEEAPPARGADRAQTLEISVEEAFLGAVKDVCVRSPQPCSQCGGSGLERFSVSRLCEPCRGSGRLRSENGLVRCNACEGRGYSHTRACACCGGSGEEQAERWLQVQVPPGMTDDDELRLAGEGEPHADPAHAPGDLRLRIRLAPHALFRRDGRNLLLQRPVSALRMLIGGPLPIPHPAGPRTVLLEPGLAHPREMRVEAAGFPARGSRPAGDLIVELVPMLPQAPDARLRALIEQLELELRTEADKHFPELAQWESDWLAD